MHSKSDNIEIIIYNKADIIEGLLNHFLISIKMSCKHQRKVVVLSLIVIIYCSTNVMKQILIVADHK